MGGAIRRVIKTASKVSNPFVKAITKGAMELTGAPSKAQIAAQQRKAAEEAQKKQQAAVKAQQAVETVDAPGVNPGDVVYSGEGEMAPKKKKRKKTPTIATGSTGVIGGAPTEKKTLLGG